MAQNGWWNYCESSTSDPSGGGVAISLTRPTKGSMKSRRTHLNRIATLLFIVSLCSSIAASSAGAKPSMEGGDIFFAAAKHPGSSAPVNTSAPSITGTAAAGSTLTVTPGTLVRTDPHPLLQLVALRRELLHLDLRRDQDVLPPHLRGRRLQDQGHRDREEQSRPGRRHLTRGRPGCPCTGSSASPGRASYVSTALPTISGTTTQGAQLSSSTGSWNGSPTGYSYQWLRCDSTGASCSPFTTSALPTYTLTVLDVGARMKISVTASNAGGSATATSAATAVIAPLPAPPPPPPPPPAPVVSVNAPAAGSTVSGSIPFTAAVANGTPTQVTFTIDGGASFTEYQAPYVYNGDGNTLDTTTLSNATHTLAARATFSDGSSVSGSETVTVQNSTPPPPPPPPPAPPATSSNGIGVIRLGTAYPNGSGYNRYGYILVGYGDVDAAAAQPGTSLVYKGGVDVVDSSNADLGMSISGVNYKQALANGWLLKDSAGNYLKSPSYGDWMGDVGDPNFQKAWVDNVSTFLLAHHADGVFIDNVLCSLGGLTGGALPAKYPTDASWATAQTAFLASVTPAMHAKGLYVAVNAYCYGPDSGVSNNAWWTRIAPYADAEMTEYFEQNPNNISQLFFNAPTTSWMGNWLGKLDVIKAAQNAGKAAIALTYGTGSSTAVMTYGKASFLLVWNGTSGGFIYNPEDATDPWNPAWTASIGTPNGAMTQVGGAYVRDYSGGYVVVNPSQSSATVSLPAGLKTLSGAAAGSSVTLATTTAAIFTK